MDTPKRQLAAAFDEVYDRPEFGDQSRLQLEAEQLPFYEPLPQDGPKNAAYRAIKDRVRTRRKMPYKKRKYSRSRSRAPGRGMDPGVRAIAATLNRSIKAQDREEKIMRAASALQGADVAEDAFAGEAGGALGVAYRNVDLRRQKAVAEGRGAYRVGRAVQRFGEGKFGGALKRAAIGGINTAASMYGMGMYTGRGSYTANSLVGGGVAPEVPQFSSVADETGAITVSRKEYLTDIYGPSDAFDVQSFNINPGLESTFPWLSQVAQNYDEYEMLQLIFTYRSTTTDIGTTSNGQCGTVIMCTNYNASAGPFTDKVVMMEYDGAMSCKTTESMLHGVECDPNKLSGSDGKYIRANPVVSNQDLKTYDHGLFQLAVANSPTGFEDQVIGELWVSYTVRLRKPKFFTARGLGISQDIFVSGGGETFTNFFGTNLLSGQQNNIGTRIDLSVANQITLTFPAHYAGFLEINIMLDSVSGNNAISTGTTLGGRVTYVSDIYGCIPGPSDAPVATVQAPNTGLVITQYIYKAHISVTPATDGVDNTWQWRYAATAGPNQASITISEYNSGFSFKANNIGPKGFQSLAPILVTDQGVVTIPQ